MQSAYSKQNLIVQLSFDLALESVAYCDILDQQKKWSLSNQFLRAALSVGANVREAQNAESKADSFTK